MDYRSEAHVLALVRQWRTALKAGFTTETLIADLPKQTALVAASDLADPARRGIRNFGER
jgi:hypothetical protein